MVRRDGLRIRCFTRNGFDWADALFTGIAPRIKASSLLIDGEAAITRDEVMPSAVCRRRWCCPLCDYAMRATARRNVRLIGMSEKCAQTV